MKRSKYSFHDFSAKDTPSATLRLFRISSKKNPKQTPQKTKKQKQTNKQKQNKTKNSTKTKTNESSNSNTKKYPNVSFISGT